jgi:hypothetical protein
MTALDATFMLSRGFKKVGLVDALMDVQALLASSFPKFAYHAQLTGKSTDSSPMAQ